MGLLDKVKAQAEQAVVKAQQGVAQGQTKIDQIQLKRHNDALLRDLGVAVYAEQRQGGSNQAVIDAMAALDNFVATHGPVDLSQGAPNDSASPTTSASNTPASTQIPQGKFGLDEA